VCVSILAHHADLDVLITNAKAKLDLHMRFKPKRTIVDSDGSMMPALPIRHIMSIFVAALRASASKRRHHNLLSRRHLSNPKFASDPREQIDHRARAITSLRVQRNNVLSGLRCAARTYTFCGDPFHRFDDGTILLLHPDSNQ